MAYVLIRALYWFYRILTGLILIRVFASWFIRNPYGAGKWYMLIIRFTEPILAPCRRLIQRFQSGMMVDFSPVVALLLLYVIYRVLVIAVLVICR